MWYRLAGVIACLAMMGCGPSSKPTASPKSNSSAAFKSGSGSAEAVKLTGSGASFPFPIYGRWFKQYSDSHPGVKVDYQSKGSGAGVKDFLNQTVDFAASDAAMKDDDIAQVARGVQLLPLTAGKIVLSYNIPNGPETLRLSREAYVNIFLGKITNWNDPVIARSNPDAKLPDLKITVVRRADSSGTTFVFTQHLSAISEDWKNGPGTGTTVVWPGGDKFIAAPKNDGVTATIKQTPGAIGYIEYGFAKLTKLPMAHLENRAGKYVKPTMESGQAALASVEFPDDLRAWITDPEAEDAYPIATFTWLLSYKKYDNPRHAEVLKDLVTYCVTEGQSVSDEMGYIPLPDVVVKKVLAALNNIE